MQVLCNVRVLMQFFIYANTKRFSFMHPRFLDIIRWMRRKILYNWRRVFFCVCCSCHYSYELKIRAFHQQQCAYPFFVCCDMMKSFSASRVVSMKIFSFKKSSTISRTWNTIFYSNLNALYNVNWSTISEWLEEIKVDVNDLI